MIGNIWKDAAKTAWMYWSNALKKEKPPKPQKYQNPLGGNYAAK